MYRDFEVGTGDVPKSGQQVFSLLRCVLNFSPYEVICTRWWLLTCLPRDPLLSKLLWLTVCPVRDKT